MKVYVLTSYCDYESEDILGIFDSLESAQNYDKELIFKSCSDTTWSCRDKYDFGGYCIYLKEVQK